MKTIALVFLLSASAGAQQVVTAKHTVQSNADAAEIVARLIKAGQNITMEIGKNYTVLDSTAPFTFTDNYAVLQDSQAALVALQDLTAADKATSSDVNRALTLIIDLLKKISP